MLLVAASILCLLAIFGLLLSAGSGMLIALFSKPIIDATWDSGLGGVNLLQIIGTLFPVIIIAKSVASKHSMNNIPLRNMWYIYIVYSIISYSFNTSIFNWLDLSFRALNGLAGYYVLQANFFSRHHFKKLLIVLILSGIFPVAIGVYQIFSGQVWRFDVTVGLIRNVGLYHDAVVIRLFAFQTLTAIVLYLAYFSSEASSWLTRIALISFLLIVLVILYRAYSKAAMLIVLLWFVIWTVSFRRVLPTIFLFFVATTIASIYYEEIAKDIARLFSKELAVAESEGEVDAWTFRRTLGGRVFSWYGAIEHFAQRSLFKQLFGDGNPANIHNDYLAKLLSGGVVGLIVYVALLAAIGIRLAANWRRRRTPMDVMGVMVFVMILIDSMGIHVTMYTSYQWFAWGIIGLALRGVEAGEKPKKRTAAAQPMPLLRRHQGAD